MDNTQLAALEQRIRSLETKRIGKNNIIPGSIQQPHVSSGAAIIIFDKASNRPTVGSNSVLAFFATNTNVLSIWNNNAWKSVTLT